MKENKKDSKEKKKESRFSTRSKDKDKERRNVVDMIPGVKEMMTTDS